MPFYRIRGTVPSNKLPHILKENVRMCVTLTILQGNLVNRTWMKIRYTIFHRISRIMCLYFVYFLEYSFANSYFMLVFHITCVPIVLWNVYCLENTEILMRFCLTFIDATGSIFIISTRIWTLLGTYYVFWLAFLVLGKYYGGAQELHIYWKLVVIRCIVWETVGLSCCNNI